MRSMVLGAALVWIATPVAIVRAYEDQLTLGIGAGYGYSATSDWPQHAALVDLSVSYGPSPSLALRGRATYGFHPAEQPLHSVIAGAELLYLIDVVEVVPYFGVGGSAIGRIRSGDFEVDAAAQLVLGLDYHLSRDLALELDVRPQLIVTELDRGPFYLTVIAGLIWLFDA